MPVGAVGGKAVIMDHLAPQGEVYQAGTLSGNPLAMAAGLATLRAVEQPNFYQTLSTMTQDLARGLSTVAASLQIPCCSSFLGGMFGFCFTDKASIVHFEDVAASNDVLFKRFYHGMLAKGVYFAPSLYEAGFVSSAHTKEDIAETLNAAEDVLKTC